MVTTYTQNLGIFLHEPVIELPERGSLSRSTSGEVKNMKRQNHVLLASVLIQRYIPFTY